jgi:preprotein translocase subunit SecY
MGRAKFNQWSRYLTVPLALLQGYGFLNLLIRQGVLGQLSTAAMITLFVIHLLHSVTHHRHQLHDN